MTMSQVKRPITILIAEDDPDDRLLALEAAREGHLEGDLHFVEDGEHLLKYLRSLGSLVPVPRARPA